MTLEKSGAFDTVAQKLGVLSSSWSNKVAESAGAIQRFSALTVRLESGADAWTLRLGNFADEAWLLFRANGGTPGSVSGGELTHLTGNLYLLRADAPTVTMERKEK